MKNTLPKTMMDFHQTLLAAGRVDTARGYRSALSIFCEWAGIETNRDALRVSPDDLADYQIYLATEYRSKRTGEPIQKGTQSTMLSAVKAYYDFLNRNEKTIGDIAEDLKIKAESKDITQYDYLTKQETTAFIHAQVARTKQFRRGSAKWAKEVRDLAFIALAIASGRRRKGLIECQVSDINFETSEMRCEREKGKHGRVLPIIDWCMDILQVYIAEARPILNWWMNNDVLFVGCISPHLTRTSIENLLRRIYQDTCEGNPDLSDLPNKKITTHSFRVTFAKTLYDNGRGADVRTINELMMHEKLSTTGYYLPSETEELRSVCRRSHPRS